MHVCVYCASSNQIAEDYFEIARALGTGMSQRGWALVYGGGSVGLMGALAETIHAAGGTVIGIIPQALLDREVAYLAADELIVTTTLRQRKQMMDDRADAFVILPGGFGTLEEMLEIITLRQLQYHTKPIIIVNAKGFFNALLAQFEHIFMEGFANKKFLNTAEGPAQSSTLYTVVSDVHAALVALETSTC
jgi:cytokinin riboside 5'-monophosphate phosphoribohydrolase